MNHSQELTLPRIIVYAQIDKLYWVSTLVEGLPFLFAFKGKNADD